MTLPRPFRRSCRNTKWLWRPNTEEALTAYFPPKFCSIEGVPWGAGAGGCAGRGGGCGVRRRGGGCWEPWRAELSWSNHPPCCYFASTDTAVHYNLPVEEPMAVQEAFIKVSSIYFAMFMVPVKESICSSVILLNNKFIFQAHFIFHGD